MKHILGIVGICIFVCSGCQVLVKNQPPNIYSYPESFDTEKVWVEAQTRKIWVNSYVDDNGDMISGHYKYVVITPGHWAAKGE